MKQTTFARPVQAQNRAQSRQDMRGFEGSLWHPLRNILQDSAHRNRVVATRSRTAGRARILVFKNSGSVSRFVAEILPSWEERSVVLEPPTDTLEQALLLRISWYVANCLHGLRVRNEIQYNVSGSYESLAIDAAIAPQCEPHTQAMFSQSATGERKCHTSIDKAIRRGGP